MLEVPFHAVLWDLDGTLIDSEHSHFLAWNATLGRHGHDYDYAAFRAGFGQSNGTVLAPIFPGASPAQIVSISDEKEVAYRELLGRDGADLLPGVRLWLDRFRVSSVVQVISSSAPMANIIASLGATGIGDYFRTLLSGAQLPRGKPSPDLFLKSAASAGAAPDRTLVIEDSIHGVEAARRAEMACIVAGPLAGTAELERLLSDCPGPPCLGVASLDILTLEMLTVLAEAE